MNRVHPSVTVDWAELRARLRTAQRALAGSVELPPEQLRAVLEARARALAAEPPSPQQGESLEVLKFVLAHEQYGIETAWVREVFPLRELTPVPGTPAFVLGVVNVRGRIVSVLDIRHFFELPQTGLSDLDKVMLLGDGSMEFGVLADAIVGVRVIAAADWQAPLPTLTGIRADDLKGITRRREVVLDARKLMADPAILVSATVEG